MNKLFSLEGRVALVTGGSRGIGRMMAAGLLHHGATVYVTARKAADCEAAAAELSRIGPCAALPGDMSTVDGARALAATLSGRTGRLHIVVDGGASFARAG